MLLDWHYAGEVERLGHESIATQFFHVIFPIWPGATYYRTTLGSFEIPRKRSSVVLGLVRTPLWFLAGVLAAPAIFDPSSWLVLAPFALVVAFAAAFATWGIGRLAPGERARREMFQRLTGLGAPPELLPREARERRRADLADSWYDEHGVDWRSSIRQRMADEMLVVLAEYYADPRLAIRARTNLLDALGN